MVEKFHVIRDQKEKKGWYFSASTHCDGMSVANLPTGDYTIRGYETKFIIERKGSTGEWAKNIVEQRFERELVRLEDFQYAFIVCEFTMSDMFKYPIGSGVPQHLWKKLRINSNFIIKRTLEIQLKYKTKIIFAGHDGFRIAWGLFHNVLSI